MKNYTKNTVLKQQKKAYFKNGEKKPLHF